MIIILFPFSPAVNAVPFINDLALQNPEHIVILVGVVAVEELSFEVVDADDSEYDEEQNGDDKHVEDVGNCFP